MEVTDIINCIVGIIGLVASITAICISIGVNRRQYKIDLFNKRISYYHACHTIITGCCLSGMEKYIEKDLAKQGLEYVCYDSEGTRFLFDKETSDFISDVFSKWIDYSVASSFLKGNDGNNVTKEEYENIKKTYEETKEFFRQSREQLPIKFEKYLKLI